MSTHKASPGGGHKAPSTLPTFAIPPIVALTIETCVAKSFCPWVHPRIGQPGGVGIVGGMVCEQFWATVTVTIPSSSKPGLPQKVVLVSEPDMKPLRLPAAVALKVSVWMVPYH